jgi:hypothetical protein
LSPGELHTARRTTRTTRSRHDDSHMHAQPPDRPQLRLTRAKRSPNIGGAQTCDSRRESRLNKRGAKYNSRGGTRSGSKFKRPALHPPKTACQLSRIPSFR